jgi:hypothetical protein
MEALDKKKQQKLIRDIVLNFFGIVILASVIS